MKINSVNINQRAVPESSCASLKRASNPTVAANADDFLMAGPKSVNWSYADLAAYLEVLAHIRMAQDRPR